MESAAGRENGSETVGSKDRRETSQKVRDLVDLRMKPTSIFSAKLGDTIAGPFGLRLTVIDDNKQDWDDDDVLVVYLLRVADETRPPPDPKLVAARTKMRCPECRELCWVVEEHIPNAPTLRYSCLRCAAENHPDLKEGVITLRQLAIIKAAALKGMFGSMLRDPQRD